MKTDVDIQIFRSIYIQIDRYGYIDLDTDIWIYMYIHRYIYIDRDIDIYIS